MTIRMIGIRQFGQNLSKLLQEAQEKDVHFVVMRHGKPVANVSPAKQGVTDADLDAEGIDVDALKRDMAKATEDVRHGRVYSTEEARRMLGLWNSSGRKKPSRKSRNSRKL